MVASRPATQPPHKETSLSLRLSVVMETSQVSVLPAVAPAVHCGICGSVLKNVLCQAERCEAFSENEPTNQLLLYIVCVNARWEPSHAARRRKTSKSPLYCSVPNVCMCVGVLYACI